MHKLNFDIDIDVGNREQLLQHFDHRCAVIESSDGFVKKHGTGVYFHDIPSNNIGQSVLDYKCAINRGYFKFDILNVSLYSKIKDETMLCDLMVEPDWKVLDNHDFFQQIIHIKNHYDFYKKLKEPIMEVMHLAMFLALIRPAKRHLVGESWNDIEKQIWTHSDKQFSFKKSHSVAYSHLVMINMNMVLRGMLN